MANVTIDKAKKTVTIVLPLEEDGRVSKSGKSTLIATTGGGLKTTAQYDGKGVDINVNVYTKN